jgi:hypothetical protein
MCVGASKTACVGFSTSSSAKSKRRLRTGHEAKNMAVARHFAINLVRAVTDKKSLKLRRKAARWDLRYMKVILSLPTR